MAKILSAYKPLTDLLCPEWFLITATRKKMNSKYELKVFVFDIYFLPIVV